MASGPNTLDELPWLTPAPRKTLQAKLARHGRSALLLGALAAPLLIADNHFGWSAGEPEAPPQPEATPAVIESPFAPQALRPLTPEEAEVWNRKIPQADTTIVPATPFSVTTASAQTLARSLQCMTAAVYYEAGNEPVDGQRAVAQVVLNRMRSPVYPNSVCGVVYQGAERKTGCQFTFTCDGSLARAPSNAGWARASGVAASALAGYVYAPVGWATHYHADYVVPYWAQSLAKLTTVGRHIFYGWKGPSGSGAGFTSRYAGLEPEVGLAPIGVEPILTPRIDAAQGVVRITSAERPMIDFGTHEAPAAAAKAAPKDKAGEANAEPLRPTVSQSARWVIGGASHGSTGTRLGSRTIIAAQTPDQRSTADSKSADDAAPGSSKAPATPE